MKSERNKWRGIRRRLITQIVAVESEYILSQPQGLDFSRHKNSLCAGASMPLCLTTIHGRLLCFFLFRFGGGEHSWQFIDLSALLESWTLTLHMYFFFLQRKVLDSHFVIWPSLLGKAQWVLWAGTMGNRMFVLLPSPGSFSELHLSRIKTAPAKLFSAIKANESYYAPAIKSNPVPWNRICTLTTSLNQCCPC